MKLPRMMAQIMALAVAVCWPGMALAAGEYVNPSLQAQVGSVKAAKILEFLNEGKGDAPRMKTVAVPVAKPALNALPALVAPAARPAAAAQAEAEEAAPMKLASLPVPAKKPAAPKRDSSYIAFDPAKEARNAKKGPRFELSGVAPRKPKPGTVNEAKVMPVSVAALPAPARPERAVKTADNLPPSLPVIPDNAAKRELAAASKVDQAFDNVEPVLANATLVPVQGGSALMPPSLPVKEARAAMPEVRDESKQQLASNASDAEIQQLAAIAPAAGATTNDAAPMQLASVVKPSAPIQVAGQFTRNVVDRSPVDHQRSAVIADGKLMFFSEVQGMSGKSLLHRWKVNGKVVEERRFPVASNEWRTWSQLWLKPDYVGTITVEMLSDGKVVGSESIEVKS